ncbi:MAG TPA: hypothetical protein VK957_15845 [Lunatimonas sp.]|nr:hypothetical protein [Lunatimonas sp.]
MKNIKKFRKIIKLFRSYGIHLTGKLKEKNFYHQLNMDEIYVHGLIFEAEYLLGFEIEVDWKKIQRPVDLIKIVAQKKR